MRNFFYSLIFLAGCFGQINAQNISTKLTGKIIGTTTGYDYNTRTTSTINTALKVFDGNLQTYLAAAERSGGWAGLDLGEPCIITAIAYCPNSSRADRMVLGVIEGANTPDFGDAIPLFVISDVPATAKLTTQNINCSKGFRYVRYIGPVESRSAVAEVVFYGFKGKGDLSALKQLTNIPTVIINTTNAEDIVSKDYYIKGTVSVITENGSNIYTDSLNIKGRGNYSWGTPKKPYHIKLYNKTNLVGMPSKAKDWTLINNYGDKTLMRNLLAFDLSKRLEMPYTPSGKPVDLFLNGEYKGCYQLCDQVEVNLGRVEVEKMEETDIQLPNLSGGYLIEMDAYAYNEASWFSSNRGIPVTIKYPQDDEITPQQSNYISSHFNAMENGIFSNLPVGINKYIDTYTFLRHFLVGELSGNTDTYWSTNMYKKRNDDKFYFGPVWDFDIAYENDNRTYPINDNPEWVYASKGSTAGGVREFVNQLFYDSSINNKLSTIWASYRDRGIISEDALLKVVDNYASELEESQKLNFIRWPVMNEYVHQNPAIWGSYEGEVGNVKNYIKNRIAWMDNKLDYVPGTKLLEIDATSKIHHWIEDKTLHIEGLAENARVQIFDLTGRQIKNLQASGSLLVALEQGSYIVQISDKHSGNQTIKCIIR